MRWLRSCDSWDVSTICGLSFTEGTRLLCGLHTSPASSWKLHFTYFIDLFLSFLVRGSSSLISPQAFLSCRI